MNDLNDLYINIFLNNPKKYNNSNTYWKEEVKALFEYLKDYDKTLFYFQKQAFQYYPDVFNDEEFGRYMVNIGLFGEIDEALKDYVNYELIGKNTRLSANGKFVSNGFIEIYSV
jgi:hypothetical protein